MQRRDFLKTSILGAGVLMNTHFMWASDLKTKKISLLFDYQINFNSAKEIKLWIPMPLKTSFQEPKNIKIQGNYDFHKITSLSEDTPIIHVQYGHSHQRKNLSIALDVLIHKDNKNPQGDPKNFINPSRYIRTDGIIEKIASDLKRSDKEQNLKQISEWISNNVDAANAKNIAHTRSLKSKDSKTLLAGENISATTLFVSLCRACGIPAREAFGLEIQNSKISIVSKAEAYVKNWVKYDPIASIKNPAQAKGYPKDFILLNYQRDMPLKNFTLNTFDRAFGLVDNDRLSYYDKNHFSQNVSYKV